MDKFKEDYAALQSRIRHSKIVVFDYVSHPDMQVIFLFQMMGTESTGIYFKNGHKKVFPIRPVDVYLAKHPEKFHKITLLSLNFDTSNSNVLLEMVAYRFPKLERLSLNYSPEHPAEHIFAQFQKMSNLIEINLTRYPIKNIFDYMREYRISPLPKVTKIQCGAVQSDLYEYFDATFPVLFPNLEDLLCLCPTKEFADKVKKNARMLFPKLQKCQAKDVSEALKKIADEAKKEKDDATRKEIANVVNECECSDMPQVKATVSKLLHELYKV